MKKFVCCCVSIIFIIYNMCVSRSYAVPFIDIHIDDFVISDSKFTSECIEGGIMSDRLISDFENYVGSTDDYYFIFLTPSASSYIDCSCAYIKKSDITIDNFYYDSVHDYYVVDFDYIYLHSDFAQITSGDEVDFCYQGTFNFIFDYDYTTGEYTVDRPREVYGPNGVGNVNTTSGIFTNLFDGDFKKLKFTLSSDLCMNMDLDYLGDTFDIFAENETDIYYDYMIYISERPSNIGVINSFNSSKWFMSSKQWCYQWLQDYSALNGSIEDYIADNISDGIKGADILDYTFGNGMYNSLFNAWGGAFDGAKEYFSVDDETMSFYQVSQTNCPVYRINPNDRKTHTISYSSLNLELGKTYYLNIIYTPVDFKAYSAMTTPIVDAGTGQQGNYPVFDTRDIAKYTVYDSYEFSVINGVFSQDSNTLYSYSDLIKYTNPSKSTAKIESDDDEIIVSDNDSYDNSVSTEYINYGQIYHGCTFYNGSVDGSGGSGGLVEENIELKIYGVDDLDFELTQLSEPVNKFQQFMQAVFGFLPEEMVGLFILGISTCVICRILGR